MRPVTPVIKQLCKVVTIVSSVNVASSRRAYCRKTSFTLRLIEYCSSTEQLFRNILWFLLRDDLRKLIRRNVTFETLVFH